MVVPVSRPTQIYLLAVLCAAIGWLLASTLLAPAGDGVQYRGDPYFDSRHSDRLRQSLRGRIQMADGGGADVGAALSTLLVEVRAREEGDGGLAVLRTAPVDVNGLFYAPLLPEGTATVSVLLGGGDVVWRAEGIRVSSNGARDPRLDPIDLTSSLSAFTLAVVGPDGEPVDSGHLAWREGALSREELTFTGDAPIKNGRSTFVATTPSIDAVVLVPGADLEWGRGLWSGDVLHLGEGTAARLELTGGTPEPRDWTIRAGLVPIALEPRIEYDLPASVSSGALVSSFDSEGIARIPVSRAGRYRLRWWALPHGGNRRSTVQIDGAVVELPAASGEVPLEVPFPVVEFARRVQGAGR